MGLGFGMIFAPAINTATAGVCREDSGVASALVNTMQQVGGSIGTSALSTIALTATASYLTAHHTGPLAPAIAATHGYTTAFAVSAGIFGSWCDPRDRPAALAAEARGSQGRRRDRAGSCATRACTRACIRTRTGNRNRNRRPGARLCPRPRARA